VFVRETSCTGNVLSGKRLSGKVTVRETSVKLNIIAQRNNCFETTVIAVILLHLVSCRTLHSDAESLAGQHVALIAADLARVISVVLHCQICQHYTNVNGSVVVAHSCYCRAISLHDAVVQSTIQHLSRGSVLK